MGVDLVEDVGELYMHPSLVTEQMWGAPVRFSLVRRPRRVVQPGRSQRTTSSSSPLSTS